MDTTLFEHAIEHHQLASDSAFHRRSVIEQLVENTNNDVIDAYGFNFYLVVGGFIRSLIDIEND